jgi:hypothetical protein
MERTIYCERILDWVMKYIMCWPLELTMGRDNPWVRVAGIPLMLAWFPIGGPVFFLCAVPLLVGLLFESTWKERL